MMILALTVMPVVIVVCCYDDSCAKCAACYDGCFCYDDTCGNYAACGDYDSLLCFLLCRW